MVFIGARVRMVSRISSKPMLDERTNQTTMDISNLTNRDSYIIEFVEEGKTTAKTMSLLFNLNDFFTTSEVLDYTYDERKKELVVSTENSIYVFEVKELGNVAENGVVFIPLTVGMLKDSEESVKGSVTAEGSLFKNILEKNIDEVEEKVVGKLAFNLGVPNDYYAINTQDTVSTLSKASYKN